MATTASPLSISTSINIFHSSPIQLQTCYRLPKSPQPIRVFHLKRTKVGATYQNWSKSKWGGKHVSLLSLRRSKDGNLWGGEEKKREKRAVKVRFKQGFGFNGGGGGSGRDDGTTARVLGNLALAILLTYLTMTDQLGWFLDTIVSLWLLAFILPIVGIGAFLWWAGRDMIQGTCPNCGNAFQVFKSSLKDELQLCPYCSQPFSVEGNEFVKEPIKFSSKRSTAFGQAFDGFTPWSTKGKDAKTTVVFEAEVKDAD